MSDLPYRLCAGFMLANAMGQIFVGERLDQRAKGFWQMPQGGIDPGEAPQAAALRELEEETGIGAHQVEIIAGGNETFKYDLPPELLGKIWKGKYRGQEQYWYLGRFTGEDGDVNLNAHDPAEFGAWKWVDMGELPELIVPFKREVYKELVAQFAPLL